MGVRLEDASALPRSSTHIVEGGFGLSGVRGQVVQREVGDVRVDLKGQKITDNCIDQQMRSAPPVGGDYHIGRLGMVHINTSDETDEIDQVDER